MIRWWLPVLLCFVAVFALPFPADEIESDDSRRVLGSSVVTSVSVIMDLGNGTKKYFADAAGKPLPKPTAAALVGSPAQLLNPDRYEFYTFDESGDLVKRLMTLDEIQGIIANGEGEFPDELPLQTRPNYYHQKLPGSGEMASIMMSDKTEEQTMDMEELSPSIPGVKDVVLSVQNVLKEELSKNQLKPPKPVVAPLPPSTISSPDSSWSIIISAPVDQTMQSSPAPNTAGTTTMQPSKFTATTVENSSTNASNADTTKAQTPKPSTAAEVSYQTTNSNRITTPQPYKPTVASTGSFPAASNFITTTLKPQKISATSAEFAPAASNIRNTTVQYNATSNEISPTASSLRTTTVPPHKPNTTSAQSSQVVTKDRTTEPPKSITTSAASIVKTTNTEPQKSNTTSVELSVATTKDKPNTSPQKHDSTSSESNPAASDINITTKLPQKPSATSTQSHTVAHNTRTTTVQPEQPSTTSIDSFSSASNGIITSTRPQNPSAASTEPTIAATNDSITSVQTQKITTTSAELSPAASVVKVTTKQPQKPSLTSVKLTSVASNVRTTTPQTQTVSPISEPIPAANNVITTSIPPQKPSTALDESADNYVKIATVEPKKPSVTSVEASPDIINQINSTIHPQKPSASSTESFLTANNIRITTMQPEKLNHTMTEIFSTSSNIGNTTTQSQKPNVTSTEPAPAASNVISSSVQPEKANATSNELSAVVSNIRTTTVPPKKTTLSSSVYSTIKTTTARPQKYNISSTQSNPADVSLKTVTVQPQNISNTSALVGNTQSLPVSNKTNNTTLKPQKLGLASTPISAVSASSTAVYEDKIKTQPHKPSTNLGTASHAQTSMTADIKNTSSTTTPLPTDSTNTNTSDKTIQENVSKLSTTLNGLGASSEPSSLAPGSHTTDRNIAATIAYNEIDSLPTSDVIAQLSDNNEEIAAAQEFIKLFTPSHSSSSGLNTEESKIESMFSKVSGQTTAANTFQQSNTTSTVATVPHYYNSVTGTSAPPTKTTTGASIVDQAASNVESVSTLIPTASPIVASSKVPLESVNDAATLSMAVKPTTLPHLNSSSNVTEDTNMLKIEAVRIPEASATNAVPVSNSSSHASGQIPAKTENSSTTEVENSSNSEDVMAELADSLSLVLSQVGGSVTTIDYGEELLLMGSSSITDSSTIQSSVTTTTEAESNTAVSHISDSTVTSHGNYDNIMNIKEIMSTAANKQQSDIRSTTENTLQINNRISAGSFTSEVKVKSPTNNNSILKVDSSKTKENSGSEKNGYITAEIKKPTIDRYETTTFSIDLSEEQEEEEKHLSAGSTDAQNGKESNKFLVTTTEDLAFYTETTTEVVDEAVTEKLVINSLKSNEDKYSNNYKKTDIESLGEDSNSYSDDFSTPTVTYPSTTIDFTTTDSTYSADFQTVVSPTASSEIKLYFIENIKNGSVSDITDSLKQSSKQNITQETTTGKTTESNTLRIQTETTLPVTDVTQEQSTENTQLPVSSSVTGANEKVTTNSENVLGVTTTTEKPQQHLLTKETVPPQDILKLTANDTHKFDNKIQLQPAPQEKPSRRPPIREPSPSQEILKLSATDAPKVDNNVQLQTSPQGRPEHRPLTREPSPSEDILKLGPADTNKFENDVQLQPAPQESLGLEITSSNLGEDVRRFTDLCNELAFRIWVSTSGKGLTATRSLILSPFAVTSMLAMVFLGARGPTSGQMNDILRLDDMVTFNPHLVFRNVTESIASSTNSGVAVATFIRELYSDKTRGKLLDFYKERAQQFYDGHVEEVNFGSIGDLVRRRTNLLVKRQTHGRIAEYVHGNNIMLRPPLAAFSANILQTDCSEASTDGRDGEMYFTVTPAMRQRRLVPVPAAVWRSGFLAGYEPGLDATAVSLGNDKSQVSVILVLPGQQGQLAPGDGLARLESRLIEASLRSQGAWSRLLRSLVARPGLELQLPRFSHRSLLNLTSSLQRMGLRDLFSAERADLRGINGLANDLHLSDIVQLNMFSTCADEGHTGSRHHVEAFPTSSQRSGRQEEHARKLDADDLSSLPLALRPRQARLPDSKPRLRFDRPFLYFVRHNPTGLILHMGRFNPRIRH